MSLSSAEGGIGSCQCPVEKSNIISVPVAVLGFIYSGMILIALPLGTPNKLLVLYVDKPFIHLAFQDVVPHAECLLLPRHTAPCLGFIKIYFVGKIPIY